MRRGDSNPPFSNKITKMYTELRKLFSGNKPEGKGHFGLKGTASLSAGKMTKKALDETDLNRKSK